MATFGPEGKRTSDHVYSPYGMDDDLLNKDSGPASQIASGKPVALVEKPHARF